MRSFEVKGGKDSLYDDLKRQILTMELDPDTDLDEAARSSGGWRGRATSRSARTAAPGCRR
jgi:hypothetical protein